MYTGITQGLYRITAIKKTASFLNYTVLLSEALSKGLSSGDSVAINGVCQTVINNTSCHVSFQAIDETLKRTTLNQLQIGDLVSVERSLRFGDEIGGHEVAGHVYGTAIIKDRFQEGKNVCLLIACPTSWMKYIIEKGFIAVDGSSLTVGKTDNQQGSFFLHLIPETCRLTLLGKKQIGDKVNIELDTKTKTIVDTIERIMKQKSITEQNSISLSNPPL